MFSELSKKRKMTVLAGILTGMLLSTLTSTIVSTAMPKILSDLGGMEYLSWALTAYMLTSTISIPIFGKLADMYGRKPFYLGGVVVFLAGSILCGTSTTMTQFIIYRAVAGLGGGIMQSNSLAIVADIFPPAERGKYQGLMGGVFGLSSVIGPTLGGYITDNLNWSWVFWVNIPIGLLAIIILGAGLPYAKQTDVKKDIDYLGTAFIIAAFTPLLIAFSWAGTKYAWNSKEILGLLVFSFISLVIFIFVESKAKEPIVPLSLFKNSIFNVSALTGFFMAIGMFGTIMYIPMFVQGVLGKTASNSGLITTPMMLGLVIASTISGQIVSRTGKYKKLALSGFAIMAAGMVLLSFMGVNTTDTTVVINMIITGVGIGITMPVFVIAVQSAFPHNQVGVVTASVQFFRNIGGTFGIAVMGSILNSRFRSEALKAIPDTVKKILPPEGQNIFDTPQTLFNPKALDMIKEKLPSEMPELFTKLMGDLKKALEISIQHVFFTEILVVLGALIITFSLKEIPLRKSNRPIQEEAGVEMLAEGLAVEGSLLPSEGEPDLAGDGDEKA